MMFLMYEPYHQLYGADDFDGKDENMFTIKVYGVVKVTNIKK